MRQRSVGATPNVAAFCPGEVTGGGFGAASNQGNHTTSNILSNSS